MSPLRPETNEPRDLESVLDERGHVPLMEAWEAEAIHHLRTAPLCVLVIRSQTCRRADMLRKQLIRRGRTFLNMALRDRDVKIMCRDGNHKPEEFREFGDRLRIVEAP